jgi:hypothetical protein
VLFFCVQSDLKQDGVLSITVSSQLIRKAQENQEVLTLNGTPQFLVGVDDVLILLLSENVQNIKKKKKKYVLC